MKHTPPWPRIRRSPCRLHASAADFAFLLLPLPACPRQVPKFKIDAEKWTAPYVPYAWGWWERFMLKK